jgi:predicted component of type VI protein secretion system
VIGLCTLFLLTGLLFACGAASPARASEMDVLLDQMEMANPAQAAEVKVLLNGKELPWM